MSSAELREQVGRVSAGDTVTARFTHGLDEYTVSGVARDDEGWLRVGGTVLRRNDTPVEYLLAIESHEPAKPPVPPEPKPTDDLVLLDDRDRPITRFGSAWRDWSTGEYVAWEHLDWPLRVYRPEPSPERIEKVADAYAGEWSGCGGSLSGVIAAAIREALGGES